MTLLDLDHVNIRTKNLEAMTSFYAEILGLEGGPRPEFRFGGAWLYCGEKAAVHLVEIEQQPETGAPRIEHFAFKAKGLAAFLQKLREAEVAYRISIVPGLEIRQVNIYDPDGNHIEIAFDRDEEADLSSYP